MCDSRCAQDWSSSSLEWMREGVRTATTGAAATVREMPGGPHPDSTELSPFADKGSLPVKRELAAVR